MDSRRTTISDIARKASVGVGTVSRVLNHDPKVKDSTRQKVQSVIKKMGYQPSFTARSLRTQKTHVIGFIADAVATTPYAVNVIKGAQDAAWEKGKLLLVVDADNDAPRRERAIKTMLERKVEGVIYAAMFHQEVILTEDFKQIPTVLVDCYDSTRSFPSVVPNEVLGGQEATLKLIEANHKRIGLITVDQLKLGFPASIGRLMGYKQALAAHTIPYDAQLICEGAAGTALSGYQHTLHLMQLAKPPTAIFCGNDQIAMGAYDALKSLGLLIPDDVSVVGFDNLEVIAPYLNPPLSTMALPHYAMGQWAINYLLSAIKKNAEPIQKVFPCPFIQRASIGRLLA